MINVPLILSFSNFSTLKKLETKNICIKKKIFLSHKNFLSYEKNFVLQVHSQKISGGKQLTCPMIPRRAMILFC